ncbi:MAG TPA: hypothetical protein VGE29_02700 [Prosthecobacter sp.]
MSSAKGTFLKSLSFAVRAGFKDTVIVPHPTDPELNRSAVFEGATLPLDGFALPGNGNPLTASPLKSSCPDQEEVSEDYFN